MIKLYKKYLLFLIIVLTTISISATEQQNKQADSLIKAATKNVYENPNQAITSGKSIFENETYSIKTRTRALILISSAYSSKRDYKKALEYIIKAKEFSNSLDDDKLQIQILFRTGVQYQQLKIFDKSIESMEEIEKRSLTSSSRDSTGTFLAASYLVKGFIYKDNLNCDIALEFFNKALNEYDRLGKNYHNRSIGFYNKGNCHILLSEYKQAKESFNKAIEYANFENASSLVSFAQKGMAEVYTLEGKYQEAIILLQSALNKSKNVGDLVLNSSIYKGLFENYLALNKWNEYQKYYDLFLKIQLEIKISERNSVSDSITENSKIFNEELNQVHSQFKNKLIWTTFILLIFIIIVFILGIKNKKIIKTLQKKIESFQTAKPLIKIK